MSARAAVALAAGMGLGRFAYTPILPLMTAQAGLTASAGAGLATANYLGYFAGAVAATAARLHTRAVHRAALVVLTLSLAGMPLTHGVVAWSALRFIAGAASALVFVLAVSTRPGWGMSGVGAGIALSGVVVLADSRWQVSWWLVAGMSALFTALAWQLRPVPRPRAATARGGPFARLFAGYALEGVGYIIAGTFLVAAAGPLGSGAWVLTGLAAAASPFLLARLDQRRALTGALVVQAAGIALPALSTDPVVVVLAFVLFGATFLGIALTALNLGAGLHPNSAALLTAGYSAGQVAGPLLASPLLSRGYQPALLLGAAVVLTAAGVIALPRPDPPRPSRRRSSEKSVTATGSTG
ncbi:YbfB/YjiJ family MFS transporter [Lentzea chajnantorensis]